MPSQVTDRRSDLPDAGVAPVPRTRLSRLVRSSEARAGVLLLVCSMAGHVGNYLYYVIAARALTPAEFAEVSALTGLATIAFMPATGVQTALARDVAVLSARGEHDEADGLVRAVARRVAFLQTGLMVVLVLGAPAAVAVLGLTSIWVWLVGSLWIVLGLGLQISLGTHQGREHFGRVGAILAGPQGLFRPLFLVPLAAVAGIVGALGALVVATIAGLVMSFGGRRRRARAPVRRITFSVGPALVALAAFASLTNLDLLVAKVTLEPTEAGIYASAALLGKVALYGPSALAFMLLPKVTARMESALPVRVPALLTMTATLLSGGAVAAAIALAPASLVSGVFGAAYADAYPLAAPLALAMTLLALVNVHIMMSLARADRRLIGMVTGAALLQAVGLLVLGDTPGRMVQVTIVVAVGTLVLHELTSPFGLVRLSRQEPLPVGAGGA